MNPVVYFEIGCKEMGPTTDFYREVFGWKIEEGNHVNAEPGGIGGHFTSLGHEPHQYVTVYLEVDDVEAYLTKAAAAGGERVVGPMEIPGGKGTFGWFRDPGGNVLGVYRKP